MFIQANDEKDQFFETIDTCRNEEHLALDCENKAARIAEMLVVYQRLPEVMRRVDKFCRLEQRCMCNTQCMHLHGISYELLRVIRRSLLRAAVGGPLKASFS